MDDSQECIGIRYLSSDDIVEVNKAALSCTPGEIDGFLIPGNLLPAQQAPAQYAYYEQCRDIFTLAAVLYIKLNKGHIFNNANKRTAFIASTVFLRINGYIFEPDTESALDVAINVATDVKDYLDPFMLSSWFKAFCREAADTVSQSNSDLLPQIISKLHVEPDL